MDVGLSMTLCWFGDKRMVLPYMSQLREYRRVAMVILPWMMGVNGICDPGRVRNDDAEDWEWASQFLDFRVPQLAVVVDFRRCLLGGQAEIISQVSILQQLSIQSMLVASRKSVAMGSLDQIDRIVARKTTDIPILCTCLEYFPRLGYPLQCNQTFSIFHSKPDCKQTVNNTTSAVYAIESQVLIAPWSRLSPILPPASTLPTASACSFAAWSPTLAPGCFADAPCSAVERRSCKTRSAQRMVSVHLRRASLPQPAVARMANAFVRLDLSNR